MVVVVVPLERHVADRVPQVLFIRSVQLVFVLSDAAARLFARRLVDVAIGRGGLFHETLGKRRRQAECGVQVGVHDRHLLHLSNAVFVFFSARAVRSLVYHLPLLRHGRVLLAFHFCFRRPSFFEIKGRIE